MSEKLRTFSDFLAGKHRLQNRWIRTSGPDAWYHYTADEYGHARHPLLGPFSSIGAARASLHDYCVEYETGVPFFRMLDSQEPEAGGTGQSV